jgi:AraC-like DNA-binding protein
VAYREHRVEGPLGQWIECAWSREGPDGHDRIVPDGCMDLIWSEQGGLQVVGPNRTAFLSPLRGGKTVVGVRLHPGAAPPVFGLPAPALLDARLPAAELWGDQARRVEERMRGGGERLQLLVGLVSSRATVAPDPLVRAAAQRLESARVADVATELAVSERHLRRLVSANVGYGPKLLGRVLRLRSALERVRAGAELAEVAFDSGYADQAHFSQDCRALAGVPPGRFLQDAAAPPRDDADMTEKARLGWVIVYVSDVRAAIEFYETTFALERNFVADDGSFGELDTGETRLAFASEVQAESNFDGGYERPGDRPFNVEIALVFDDPAAAFRRAVENGASAHAQPTEKPWGQVVAYVRDPFGTLIELASPTD